LASVPALSVDVGAVGGMAGVVSVAADAAQAGPIVPLRPVGGGGVAAFGVMGMVAGVVADGGPAVQPLAGTVPVGAAVPEVAGIGAAAELNVVGLPVFMAVTSVRDVEMAALVTSGIAVAVPVTGNGVLRLAPLKAFAKQDVDPFLGLVDIWEDGPLGELKKAAKRAAEAGDEAEYRRLAAAYWQAMTDAMVRRDANQKRVDAEKKRGMQTRGRGVPKGDGQAP
jgi:hypothetical protein